MHQKDMEFHFRTLPQRVSFGVGHIREVSAEMDALGAERAAVLTTPGRTALADQLRPLLGARFAGAFPGAVMHTPVEVTDAAQAAIAEFNADAIISVGGGSTIGLGKALSLRTGLPHIVIPTTYAGSEATPVLGQTANGVKTTMSAPAILPASIIYDVTLTTDLPARTSLTSGINAIAHAVEALYAVDGNPVTSMMAEEAVRQLGTALPQICADPANIEARSAALYGAWLCGICLATAGMALHHKLCHTLGGSFGLPHADVHTILLPHVLAYNAPAAAHTVERLSRALGCDDPAARIYDLSAQNGGPVSLAEIGFTESNIAQAVDLALTQRYPNPRPLERAGLEQLLHNAVFGTRPSIAP